MARLVRLLKSGGRRKDQPVDLEERAAHWRRQILAEGEAIGRAIGRKEGRAIGEAEGESRGLARERSLLRRQVALRFGAATADRFAALVEDVSDPERLAEAGEWIIKCGDGAALLSRMDRAAS